MVRYLTWFAKHHGALGEECLSNCSLVINGTELFEVLEDWFHDETKGGGIYQNYVRNVETFFYDLKRLVCIVFSVSELINIHGATCSF